MIHRPHTKYFKDMRECAMLTANGEYSRYGMFMNQDDMSIYISSSGVYTLSNNCNIELQVKEILEKKWAGFLCFAFVKDEYKNLFDTLGGFHPLESEEFFSLKECSLYYSILYHSEKKQTTNPFITDPFKYPSWCMVKGESSPRVVSKQEFRDKILNTVTPLSVYQDPVNLTLITPAFSIDTSDVKKFFLFRKMNEGSFSCADDNSNFLSRRVCRILQDAYKKESEYVWFGNKVIKRVSLKDKNNFDCFAYALDDFDNAEINCIRARTTDYMEDLLTYKYSEVEDIQRVHIPVSVQATKTSEDWMAMAKARISQANNQETNIPFVETDARPIVDWYKKNTKEEKTDNIINEEWKESISDVEVEGDIDEVPEGVDVNTEYTEFPPDVTPSLENKIIVGEYKDIYELLCDQYFALTVIDFSNRPEEVTIRDLEESTMCVEMFSTISETLIILDPDHSNLSYRAFAKSLQYIDTGVLMLEKDEAKSIGSLFRRQAVFTHFFMKKESPRFFHSPFLSIERLFSICIDLLREASSDGDALIINNQRLSSQLLGDYQRILQAYTSASYVGETNIEKSIAKEKINLGKNGQTELFG